MVSHLLALLVAGTGTATVSDLYGRLPEGEVVLPDKARGLEEEPADPIDALLSIPRALLFPIEWTLFAIKWPVEQLLGVLEEYAVIDHVIDFLYNDERTAGVLPVFNFVSSSGVSGGAKIFHSDLFGHHETGKLRAQIGSLHLMSYDASFAADYVGGTALWTELQLRYERKPNVRYSGIGPEIGEVTNFSQHRVLGRFRAGTTFGETGEHIKIGGSVIYNRRHFGEAKKGTSIETAYDTSQIVGFDDGNHLVELTADVVLDFRDRRGFTPSGFLLEVFAGGAPPQGDYHFVHYGAEVIGFIDLFKRTRVLALRLGVEAVEAGPGRVPFSDLPRLGGASVLRGWPAGSFRDQKSVFGSIEYRWPVHANVEAHVFFDVGRVAPNYEGFVRDFGLWRWGTGGGLMIGGADSTFLVIDVAYGEGVQVLIATDVFEAFGSRTEEL